MSTAPFKEPLPPDVAARLRSLVPEGEEKLIHVAADLADDRSFGEKWVVVTDRRVLMLLASGENGSVDVPISDVGEVRTDEFVGAGRLEIERKQGAPVYVDYSRSRLGKFAEVAEGIRQLTRGEPLLLPEEVPQTRCPTCGELLAEADGVCTACISKWDTFKRIISYLGSYRRKVVWLMLIAVITPLMELLPPLLVRHIIDDVLTPRSGYDLLAWFCLGLLGIRLLLWGFEIGRGWLRAELAGRTGNDIRSQLYRHIQYMPLRFYDKRKLGTLMSRFTADSDRLEMLLLFGIPFLFTNALMLVGVLGLLFYMSWKLTLYVLLPVPFIVVGSYLIWGRMRRYWALWSAKWARLSSHLNESISGIRVVKAFAQEAQEAERFGRRNDELRQVSVTADRNWFIFFAVMSFLMSFGGFFVWYFGGQQILQGELTLGVLTAFMSYLWQLYGPIQFFSQINNWVTRAFAGAERIFEILDTKTEPFEASDAVAMPGMAGRVTFRDVNFSYDRGKPVLKGIDLDVQPGEMIGLVGRSGVGKSTMINLICRFYDPERGRIEVDGVDLRKIRLADLRQHIGMVHQESFLFDGTIAENIAYGKADAPFDDIVRAAVAAEAHEFIVRKPDGYNMKVGERGNKLSGGEKQRLAIARAILHDPRILILDEATSSLDTQTEQKIQVAISRLVAGRTTFAIAHRLSTLRRADRLVVLEDGKVAEVGTHQELMAREGIFYRLVQTQQETSTVIAVGGGKDDPAK